MSISLRDAVERALWVPRLVLGKRRRRQRRHRNSVYILHDDNLSDTTTPHLRARSSIRNCQNITVLSGANMHFSWSTILLTLSLSSIGFGQETCPTIPDTGVEIGEPVPPKPDDIPKGCSAYEILVGEAPDSSHLNQKPKQENTNKSKPAEQASPATLNTVSSSVTR